MLQMVRINYIILYLLNTLHIPQQSSIALYQDPFIRPVISLQWLKHPLKLNQ